VSTASGWSWLRHSLFLAFVLGCFVSVATSGRLSVRLVTDGALSFAFVPAIEIAAFALVLTTGTRAEVPFRRAVDLFLLGNAPWLLWIVAAMVVAGLVPPKAVGSWMLPVFASSSLAAGWSARIDYVFFRDVMQRSPRGAIQDLILFRAMAWPAATAYFLGIAIWPEIAGRAGW